MAAARATTMARRVVRMLRAARAAAGPATAPPPADDAAAREAADNRHLELLIGFLIARDAHCVDVGAKEGRFLSHLVQRAPDGRHVAFEPIPHLAAGLAATYPAVDVHQAAVAERAGRAEFVVVPEDLGYSGLRERTYPGAFRTERIEVALESLDEALPDGFAPDFIKVDVEGAELGVFRGGLETIRRHRPVIAFEHGPGAAEHYGTTPEQVHDLLVGEAGLRILDMDAAGPLSRDAFAAHFAAGTRWNYVAVP